MLVVLSKTCTDMIARIRSLAAQMSLFDFFYGLVLGELLLRHSDDLSRALQHSSISAAEGQVIASMTVTTLRADDSFDPFGIGSTQWHKSGKETPTLRGWRCACGISVYGKGEVSPGLL